MSQLIELNRLYQPAPAPGGKEPLAIALALVKNEGDIIPAWLSHACELFDLIYLVDHQSTDGTREFLLDAARALNKIHLFSFDQPGYFQSEITNQLAQWAAAEHREAWLFPVDADEFLAVASKAEFKSALEPLDHQRVLLLNWRNCVPMFLEADRQVQFNFPCLISSKKGFYNKVALNSGTLLSKQWRFAQGNHYLETASGTRIDPPNSVQFVNMIHLPIRSVDQFALKCVQGRMAYAQLPASRNSEGQGWHYEEMVNLVLQSNTLDPNMIRGFAASYGLQNDFGTQGASVYDLVDLEWDPTTFDVAHGNIRYDRIQRSKTFAQLASQLVEEKPEYTELQQFLRIAMESETRSMDVSQWQKERRQGQTQYASLPDLEPESKPADCSDMEFLHTFASKAFTPRENPVSSTWEGHVPFLYCLLHFGKPRRFVELGAQYGNSFYAACQVSNQLLSSIECIAVDTWKGDVHTGYYADDVFKAFTRILKRDYPQAKYIRNTFQEASRQFEPGSIDLLHIDGLHTYEAVSEDFTTWLPMLSARGVVLFHDTQERMRGFGVWRFWAEVKRKYPSFEFEHSHGLGVLLVGARPGPQLVRLFELMDRPEYADFLRFYFSSIGAVSPIAPKH